MQLTQPILLQMPPNGSPGLTPYFHCTNPPRDLVLPITTAALDLHKFYSEDDFETLGVSLGKLVLSRDPIVFTLSPFTPFGPPAPASLPHPFDAVPPSNPPVPVPLSTLWPSWPHCLISILDSSGASRTYPIRTSTFLVPAPSAPKGALGAVADADIAWPQTQKGLRIKCQHPLN